MGYLCQDTLENAVNFIKQLDKNKIQYYGDNAFKYVNQQHNLQDKINQYERIIKDLK
jgi:hypothetical protein